MSSIWNSRVPDGHVVLPPGVVDMNVRDQFESEDGINHGSREPEECRDGQANIMSVVCSLPY